MMLAAHRYRRAAEGMALAAGFAAAAGCSNSYDHPPGLQGCTGPGCGTHGGVSVGGGDAAADVLVDAEADSDAAATTSLSGKIVVLADARFAQPTPLVGSGTMRVPTPAGDQDVNFTSTGYKADNVLVGAGWFSVFPDDKSDDAGLGLFGTWSLQDVPASGSTTFDLPVLSRTLLSTIYNGLDKPTSPQSNAAQVVLVFERNGQRLSGVSLTSHPSCEMVAYDLGVGFSTQSSSTSDSGLVLLVNTVGTGKVAWKSTDGATDDLTIVHVPGQASYAVIDVP